MSHVVLVDRVIEDRRELEPIRNLLSPMWLSSNLRLLRDFVDVERR